jgi:hypothetical protein
VFRQLDRDLRGLKRELAGRYDNHTWWRKQIEWWGSDPLQIIKQSKSNPSQFKLHAPERRI